MTPKSPRVDLEEAAEGRRARLADAEGAMRAIGEGRADAVVVDVGRGPEVHFLGAAERAYRQFFEAIGGTAALSTDGTVLSCDANLERTLRLSFAQIAGTLMQDHVSPEGVEAFNALLTRPDPTSVVLRADLVDGEGRPVPAYLSATVLRCADASPVVFLLVTGLEAVVSAEEALAESASQLERAMTEAPIPMMIHAEDGEILALNRTWTEISGYSLDDIPTMAVWLEKAGGENVAEAHGIVGELYRSPDRVAGGEHIILTSAGEERVWDFHAAPLGALPDGRKLVVSAATDVTARVNAEKLALRQAERIERTMHSVVAIASNIVELRDPYTAGHQRRVSELAVRIAEGLGMSWHEIEDIRVAGLLHDMGKTAIPAEILVKPGALSPIEFTLIKVHPEAGYRLALSANMDESISEMIYQHHERCDGTGYPRGLAGDQTLLGAKVLAVADVVEAMMSHRPYRSALGVEAALAEIERGNGTLYDALVSEECIRVFREDGFEFPEQRP